MPGASTIRAAGGAWAWPAVPHATRAATVHARMSDEFMGMPSLLPVVLERKLTVVLPEEVQKALVFALVHVEHPRDDLVVAARLLESLADDLADLALRDLPLHVARIHDRPERFPVVD